MSPKRLPAPTRAPLREGRGGFAVVPLRTRSGRLEQQA